MKGNILSTAAALLCAAALAACSGGQGRATEAPVDTGATPEPAIQTTGKIIEIKMLTRDPDDPKGLQVFKPRLVTAKVGDTITFIPTDPAHNSTSIEGMVPEGVEGWDGPLNTEVSYVIPKPGLYGFKCLPHYAAGMIGLIVVEGGENTEAAKQLSHPGLAGGEFAELFEQAGL